MVNVFTWAYRRFRMSLADPKAAQRWFGTDTWAGKPVTPESAMNISAWWRCIRLHADVTGGLPLKFYEMKEDGSRVRLRDHDLGWLLGEDPNAKDTAQEFWGQQAGLLAQQGNAYAEKRYMGTGARKRIVSLEPLPPETWPYRDEDGDLYYKFTDRGKDEKLPAEDVFHTKGFNIDGTCDVGLSPLAAARQSLSIALATDETAGSTFSQGLRLSGFFTGPSMKEDQRKQFTQTFIDPIIGNDSKAHFGILEGGFDFKPLNIAPKDAEMLMSRRFNVEDIARWMATPPILIGHAADGQTMWGTGVEAIVNMWLTLGYDMFLRNIENSIKKRIMTREQRMRFYPEFDRMAMLRADSAGRAELYSKMFQMAGITPNQIADRENMPRFVGGDQRFINSTYVPIDEAGRKATPAATPPKPAEQPKEAADEA